MKNRVGEESNVERIKSELFHPIDTALTAMANSKVGLWRGERIRLEEMVVVSQRTSTIFLLKAAI